MAGAAQICNLPTGFVAGFSPLRAGRYGQASYGSCIACTGVWHPKMVGTVIGKYRLVGSLGRGATGVVYRAVDQTLGRDVAVRF